MRLCSRTGCALPAKVTLTYAYADQQAVLGPLSSSPEPGGFDLCDYHGQRTSVPVGWELLKLPIDELPTGADDDLLALAEAIREVGQQPDEPEERPVVSQGRRVGHLTLLPGAANQG
ncbi:MAG: hypothetical protein CSA64_00635 [Arachnia propionica]|nr:MAG: hypothetical protein CSA64_00635 [Arachnia propionica]